MRRLWFLRMGIVTAHSARREATRSAYVRAGLPRVSAAEAVIAAAVAAVLKDWRACVSGSKDGITRAFLLGRPTFVLDKIGGVNFLPFAVFPCAFRVFGYAFAFCFLPCFCSCRMEGRPYSSATASLGSLVTGLPLLSIVMSSGIYLRSSRATDRSSTLLSSLPGKPASKTQCLKHVNLSPVER